MIIAVDLDGTLCTWHALLYEEAKPLVEHIARVRKLHEDGHRIWIYTARGSSLGSEEKARERWGTVTEKQLREWGVPHEELIFGKPMFDVLIDDRALSFDGDWLSELEETRKRMARSL